MKTKLLTLLFLGMFLFSLMPLVSAESIGTFKIDQEMQITNYCNDGTCSYMNLTSIELPNSTIIFGNAGMTKNYQEFKYNYTPPILGEYTFTTCGNPSGNIICNKDTFEVTSTGTKFEQKEAIVYFIMVIGLIIFLMITVYGSATLPYKNNRSEDGKLMSVNDLKYLKILSVFMSYGILTWLANIMITISNNYVDLGIGLKFFTIMFKIMISLIYPAVIFTIILIVIEAVRGFKIKKLLGRGIYA